MSTYTPIASLTLSAATSSVTFSGIPQTYTDLVIVASYSRSASGNGLIRFNSDTASNYSYVYILGDGTTASSSKQGNRTSAVFGYEGTNIQNTAIINIIGYSNSTTNKTFISRSNDSTLGTVAWVNLWRNTSAITSVELYPNSGNFNSGSTFNIYGIDSSLSTQAKATGGNTITTDGTYWYHAFLSSGTFTPTANLTADYMVVAGGGGGGRRWDEPLGGGGGGGAGGYRYLTSQSLNSATAYTVTVGGGGAGGSGGNPGNGTKGNNSSFVSTSATGGGYGGGSFNAGGPGGSGGGNGKDKTTAAGTGNEGGYSPVEGYNGGSCNFGGNGSGAGGGGGAGGAGTNGGVAAGVGGIGTYNAITNGLKFGQLSSSNYYVAGGGGGTYDFSGSGTGGAGGLGGGGVGATNYNGVAGAGTANTGGGGGGGGGSATPGVNLGGNGGSGVVIIRYAV